MVIVHLVPCFGMASGVVDGCLDLEWSQFVLHRAVVGDHVGGAICMVGLHRRPHRGMGRYDVRRVRRVERSDVVLRWTVVRHRERGVDRVERRRIGIRERGIHDRGG